MVFLPALSLFVHRQCFLGPEGGLLLPADRSGGRGSLLVLGSGGAVLAAVGGPRQQLPRTSEALQRQLEQTLENRPEHARSVHPQPERGSREWCELY